MSEETINNQDVQQEETQQDVKEKVAAEPKTFTEEELNKKIDEVVKAKKAKWDDELERQKAQEDEAKKLEKMNADEKTKYEQNKLKEELNSAKTQLAKFEMTKQAQSMLEEANMAVSSADLDHIVTSEAESTKANVQWLIDHDNQIKEQVRHELLRGTTPRATGKGSTITRQQIEAIKDPVERQKLMAEHIELFSEFN